jgi:hypothetical protein
MTLCNAGPETMPLRLSALPHRRQHFSITSSTLFAFRKLPIRSYLVAIAIFCNEVKGKSALAVSQPGRAILRRSS